MLASTKQKKITVSFLQSKKGNPGGNLWKRMS